MVTFASLILGLVVGVHPVEVLVDGEVAAVELFVDGVRQDRLEAEPWIGGVDFGPELRPHELVAVALDGEGRPIDEARQWINLPRAPAEATIHVDRDEAGGARARVFWESVVAVHPTSARVLFDGRPLEVEDVREFPLPPHDPARLHHLQVELEFSDTVISFVETTFGGTYTEEIPAQQTAVPVIVGSARGAPGAVELQGRFVKAGAPLRVLAVDEGPSEIVVVRDRSAQTALDRLAITPYLRIQGRPGISRDVSIGGSPTLRFAGKIPKELRVRFLFPFSRRWVREGLAFELFPPSPEYTRREGGLVWLLTSIRPPSQPLERQRLADAVAVAGMVAAARDRRRAVVLILGDDPRDRSQLAPAAVGRYLDDLRVPLFVWSAAGIDAGAWGEARPITNLGRLEKELKAVLRHLDSQRIVWIEGLHLPQTISLADRGDGVRMPL